DDMVINVPASATTTDTSIGVFVSAYQDVRGEDSMCPGDLTLQIYLEGEPAILYNLRISQGNGQLISGLGVVVLKSFPGKVFGFEAKHLLMVIQIPHMFAWLDYLRWKFKFFSTVLWSMESVSGVYDVQGVKKLVEHKRRPTKLQQNVKWQVQGMLLQSCTSTKAKGSGHKVLQADLMKTLEMIIAAYAKLGYVPTVDKYVSLNSMSLTWVFNGSEGVGLLMCIRVCDNHYLYPQPGAASLTFGASINSHP
ncbi:hypothetical protein MKW92_018093, partial [Papaver armeniacum]